MIELAPELVALLAKRGKPARTSQILLMQKTLLASATSPKVKPADQARCALAWERLEERAMILRGYGKPKPVEARNAQPRRKPQRTITPIPVARVKPADPPTTAPAPGAHTS